MVLKPGGTAGTIWAQVQELQGTTAVQEVLPFGLAEAPESATEHRLTGPQGAPRLQAYVHHTQGCHEVGCDHNPNA